MRKKVGDEDRAQGGSKERDEKISMLHRKAAALAWYRHGRKGSIVLGSGKGKMPNPFSHKLATRPPSNARSGTSVSESGPSSDDEDTQPDMGSGKYVPFSHAPCHDLPPLHPQASVLQGSRFKAEAMALQSSSASSSSSPSTASHASPHVTQLNKQQLINMSTGQSLALLSLLPHHQSQKCFNLSKKGYGGSNTGSSNNNGNNSSAATAWDCGSSLYDSFELLCLSNQLGRCLTTVNAASMASTTSSSSRLLKNLATPTIQVPPLQPSYIPRSLYALPQFMIPNYLVKKASKKRSSLIHPVFTMPCPANGSSPASSLPAPPVSSPPQGNKSSHGGAEDQSRRKSETGGFRRVFNSLLKSLQMKDDKPKRSNLSEELEKLPKHRPSNMSRSTSALLHEGQPVIMASNRTSPTSSFSSSATSMASKRSPTSPSTTSIASKRSPTSTPAEAAGAMAAKRSPTTAACVSVHQYYQYHHHFRNEGFRTTSIRPPKSVKWAQPAAS